jgi:membrane associated rhomboid family serine protease
VVGELNGEWWRLGAAQFVYENVGYLLAVGIAAAIFGASLERRYGAIVTAAIFVGSGALGVWLGTQIEEFPVVYGGNGAALGLMAAWVVRDLRDRRTGLDPDTDLLGTAAIAAVIAVMPLLEPTASWAGLAGVLPGAVAGLLLPSRP